MSNNQLSNEGKIDKVKINIDIKKRQQDSKDQSKVNELDESK